MNSFNPGGTLPTHPVGPKKWTCILYMRPGVYLSGLTQVLVIVHYILVYLTFGRHKTELPYTWKTENNFPAACICWAAASYALVSMLRKLGGT